MEGVHHCDCVGQLLGGGGLEAGRPVHRYDLQAVPPSLGTLGEPRLERLLGAPLDHVEQPWRTGAVADRGQVDDDRDVLVAAAGVAPNMLVDADHLDALETVRVLDEDPPALGEHGGIGRVPRDPEAFGDPSDGQVLGDQTDQSPPQRTAGQLRPRLGSAAGVLAQHVAAAGALVAADGHQRRRRAPAQRLVRQPARDGVSRQAFAAAAPAPPVRLIDVDDPAGEHRPVRLEMLPDDLQAELIETAERGQVSAREGSVKHVEVFLDGQCENFRPRETSTSTQAPTRRLLHPQLR
ncbi:hypothetical protein ATL41_1932 [Flavimobilis soli]|uniref:Uncharacterized protein n=1 Tax=Flavimobilis soli TaxID=442709 RepID=A0A2A9EF68_9MICO|nr:hypothetical protein ATL41_1932 [Flavimobilis soli]